MGSKLQKNAIMLGYINSYCLVCECYFDTDEDTSNHIQDSGHKEKLLAHPYLEKYGDSHIRKASKGYFCEFCSVLLATAAKVSLHIQERAHYERKGTFLLHRPTGMSAVIAFDNLLIGERAWHSLSEETCAICNEEFDNESIHKTESAHLLKLVQNKVEFGPENTVYRKTDDSSFQCLTCNAVFALNTLNDHFVDAEHKKVYAKCQEEFKKYKEQHETKVSEKNKEVKDKKDDVKVIKDDTDDKKFDVNDKKDDVKNKKDNAKNKKDDVKVKKDDSEDKKFDINDKKHDVKNKKDDVKVKKDEPKDQKYDANDKKDVVKGKKADVKVKKDETKDKKCDVIDKKYDVKDKEDDVIEKKNGNTSVAKNHNNVKENSVTKVEIEANSRGCTEISCKATSTKTEPEDEATVFANGNILTYNVGNTNAFCRVCETKLPATLRSMKEHVSGKEHKNRLGRMNPPVKPKTQITKKPMDKFIVYSVNIEHMFHEDVVINMRYCVPLHSFVMMTKIGMSYRCQACEVTVYEVDVGEHVNMSRHERAMENTPVITSLPDSEFVREVRPSIYHCGYCNQIVPRWEEVASHLQSREHKDNKDACMWRLRRHLPTIAEHRRRQEEQMDMFRILMLGQMFRH